MTKVAALRVFSREQPRAGGALAQEPCHDATRHSKDLRQPEISYLRKVEEHGERPNQNTGAAGRQPRPACPEPEREKQEPRPGDVENSLEPHRHERRVQQQCPSQAGVPSCAAEFGAIDEEPRMAQRARKHQLHLAFGLAPAERTGHSKIRRRQPEPVGHGRRVHQDVRPVTVQA